MLLKQWSLCTGHYEHSLRLEQPQQQPQQPPPAGANPLDPTGAGGGNIGTGQAPIPGEQGFSGDNQGGQADIGQPQADGEPSAPLP